VGVGVAGIGVALGSPVESVGWGSGISPIGVVLPGGFEHVPKDVVADDRTAVALCALAVAKRFGE
jgi:hypothetical protein